MDTARLVKEIGHLKADLFNAMDNRQAHPGFGYTKKGIQETFYRLRGMVEAWVYITGRWDYPGTIIWTREFSAEIGTVLDGTDIRRIQDQILEAR